MSLKLGSNWVSGSFAPRSRTRLALGLDAALEAYVVVFGCEDPLPWVFGLPAGEGFCKAGGAFASLTLGWRSATVLDSA